MMNDLLYKWKECLKIIRDNLDDQSFEVWFKPITPISFDKNILTIEVPSQYYYEFIEEHFIDLLKKTIREVFGPGTRLSYKIKIINSGDTSTSIKLPSNDKQAIYNPPVDIPPQILAGNGKAINPFIVPGIQKLKINSNLIETLNFENFVEGDCNRLARSAGLAIAQNPGKTSFNPFFIYSDSGLGKTHLTHAIGIEVKRLHPDKIVYYIQAQEFLNQLMDILKDKESSLNDFIYFHQMVDVLIVDDVHSFSNKLKTQDIFFQILNTLHQKNKQIILTADKAPSSLEGFEERILSRFKGGLTADLQVPDYETRIAIIHKKIERDGIEMPEEVIEYLASNITSNIRELEGILISLIANASFNQRPITIELASSLINQYIKHPKREISFEQIKEVVCKYYNITPNELVSKTRKREIVEARQLVMYLAKQYTKKSMEMIGKELGGRDHATVHYAIQAIKNLIETSKTFKANLEAIDRMLKS